MIDLEYIPAIVWPDIDGEYKFVQVRIKNKLFIRFKPREISYHSSILQEFLKENEISYTTFKSIYGRIIPEPKSEVYEATGMGTAEIYLKEKVSEFLGSSRDYGLEVDNESLDRIALSFPDWTFKHLKR